jgi:amino acid transporter
MRWASSLAARSLEQEPLVRQLSAAGIWLLAVNGMIGAGIFGVPAGVAALAGAWSPLVFLACGFLLAAVILCFGELASYFRGTGGPILYLREAFGPMAGFQAGWAFYIARLTAFAANLNLLVAALAYFWAPAEPRASSWRGCSCCSWPRPTSRARATACARSAC